MIAVSARELVAMLRSWRAVLVQVLFLVAPGLLVLLRWPDDGHADVDGAAAGQVLRVFGYGLLVGLTLVSPAFAATSMVRERIRGTLALLLNTPMHPGEILVGKLAGSLGLTLLLLVLTIPGAAACYAMGGTDLWGQLGRLYLVLALLAIEYTCLGLFISSRARSLDGALRMTYAGVLGLSLVTLVPHRLVLAASWAGPGLTSAVEWLRSLSPIPAVVTILGDAGIGASAAGTTWRFCIVTAIISAAFLLLTLGALCSRPLDKARSAGRITDDRARAVRAWRRVMYLWFFDPQRRSGLIGPWQNPVMVKEQRCRRFGRSGWMIRLIGVYLILSLVLVFGAIGMSRSEGVSAVLGVIAVMQASLVLLLAPSFASGLIAGETESRGWLLLQSTPLSTFTIISGKLLSALVPLGLALVATIPALGVMVLFDPSLLRLAAIVFATMAALAIVAVLLSSAVGSCFRSTAPATAAAYALLAVLCGGTLMFWLGRDAPFGRRLVESVLTWNPLAATLSAVGTPGFSEYKLIPGNWYVMGALGALSIVLLVLRVARLKRAR